MEVTIDQALQLMEQLYLQRNFSGLTSIAEQAVQKFPRMATAWRFLGIANMLSGRNGEPQLQQAAVLADDEAKLWLRVIGEYSCHPKGSVHWTDLIAQVNYEHLRKSPYMEFPHEVHIETQAVCNAKCSFCPYPTMQRQGDKMADILINKIINDLKSIPPNLPFYISPHKVNEPFLDKRIFRNCEIINDALPNAKLRLFTNGSPLNQRNLEKIAHIRNVVCLWVSLNESDKAAYETQMHLPFEKTIANLDRLHQYVKAGYPHQVTLSRVGDNSPADKNFRRFVAERYPLFGCFLFQREDWSGQVETETKSRVTASGCSRWFEISIMASGLVALCCMDGEGKHVIGDINKQSVLEIYNSPQYRKLRQYTSSRLAARTPCDTCPTSY